MQKVGNYRWTICALVFFATTINYLDRQVISLLKSSLEEEFNWSESDYGNIVIAFQLSYAFGLLFAGRFIDKIGTKMGYAVATVTWSIAAIGHALANSTLGFSIARAFLGVTEAGNFPSAIKATAEWFPKKERALATGIFNSGTNIGAIVAPLTVPLIAEVWGWRWAFIITGAIGFIWLVLWFLFYEVPAKHKKLSKAEFDYIHSDAPEEAQQEVQESVSWAKLLTFKQTWAFAVGKFLTDPVWWFYLFWTPAFLKAEYKMEGTAVAIPIALLYTISTVGSIYGGYLPLRFVNQGWTVFKSRRTAMLIYAFCAVPVIFAQYLGSINMWLAILIIGIAAAGHQAWSANIFTTVSDMFPKKAVGSIVGIGGMAGAIGGVLIAKIGPALFDYYKAQGHIQTGYYIMFFVCGFAYLAAWFIMRTLVPKMKPVEI
ncbi:MAG: MFS transporter [Spirosomaceae bacterium]|jgi:ACS family hexuronate transporter-like MFS transporter|nr:MFS transporter [Spirosomataceae bacterium]